MEQHTNLHIPVNIRTRFELFDGYGMAELIPTIIAAFLSGFAAFIIHAITNGAVAPILIVLVTIAAAVVAVTKGENNLSIVDQMRLLLRFMREQRIYKFFYTEDWSDFY